MTDKHRLADRFIHLGLGASAVPQPLFDGMAWYEAYGQRHRDDGAEGRLVSWYAFADSWDSWETHPSGAETVICVAGSITLIQELPGGETRRMTLGQGEYAINAPGVWHTADVAGHAAAIFITAGEGTEHRPR